MKKAGAGCWVLGVGLCASALAAQAPARDFRFPIPDSRNVTLATTTSLYETGLIDTLATLFEHATHYHLRAVSVGSGQALKLAERGDADVVFVHSPAAELAFMRAGHGIRRRVVATNYFTIVGPPGDPAHVRDATSVGDALRRIAQSGCVFVSRGDSSGTHVREIALWTAAGGRPSWPGYIETGSGQSATLLVANDRRAYALTDRSTLGILRGRIDLVALREREPALRNVYHVIEVNPEGQPHVNAAGAHAFADFVVSDAVQNLLMDFGRTRIGEPMYTPAHGIEP